MLRLHWNRFRRLRVPHWLRGVISHIPLWQPSPLRIRMPNTEKQLSGGTSESWVKSKRGRSVTFKYQCKVTIGCLSTQLLSLIRSKLEAYFIEFKFLDVMHFSQYNRYLAFDYLQLMAFLIWRMMTQNCCQFSILSSLFPHCGKEILHSCHVKIWPWFWLVS